MELENPCDYSYIFQDLNARDRRILSHPPKYINIDIIKEFYIDAKPIEDNILDILSWCEVRWFLLIRKPSMLILKTSCGQPEEIRSFHCPIG